MDARDPAEAVEILDVPLTFFGEGERWIKGRFSDRRSKCCLVGALDVVSGRHAAGGEAAERYLADAISDRRASALRVAWTTPGCGRRFAAPRGANGTGPAKPF